MNLMFGSNTFLRSGHCAYGDPRQQDKEALTKNLESCRSPWEVEEVMCAFNFVYLYHQRRLSRIRASYLQDLRRHARDVGEAGPTIYAAYSATYRDNLSLHWLNDERVDSKVLAAMTSMGLDWLTHVHHLEDSNLLQNLRRLLPQIKATDYRSRLCHIIWDFLKLNTPWLRCNTSMVRQFAADKDELADVDGVWFRYNDRLYNNGYLCWLRHIMVPNEEDAVNEAHMHEEEWGIELEDGQSPQHIPGLERDHVQRVTMMPLVSRIRAEGWVFWDSKTVDERLRLEFPGYLSDTKFDFYGTNQPEGFFPLPNAQELGLTRSLLLRSSLTAMPITLAAYMECNRDRLRFAVGVMNSDQKPKVFRLRQLPRDTTESQTLVFLSKGLGGIRVDDIHIYSLATSLSPWRPTKTATLMFDPPPPLTEQHQEEDEWQITVMELEKPLILDTHFRGLTPLRDPTSEHRFDCISLSGLSSHPFGSWQPKKSDKTFMWIRDELPFDLPQLRPVVYGYETPLPKSRSFQTIDDLASQLISHLESNGWTSLGAKPLVFLAHSLGGLVLKRAVVALANRGDGDMVIRITGGIFFGVPNFGMEQSSFRSMAKGNPNEPLVDDLSHDSPWLQRLESQFNGISFLQKMRMFWGYETCTSPTLVLNDDGEFVAGADVILVTPQSATRGLLESDESLTFPLNENHSNIVKFSRNHEDYNVIVGKIAQICNIPPSRVAASEANESHPNSSTSSRMRLPKPPLGRDSTLSSSAQPSDRKLLDEAPARDSRMNEIEPHFRNTFDWIFDKPESGFVHWLEVGEGAFWINGSPGSGKSTLMKYIFKDHRTRELLHDFRNPGDEVFAGFFFHHRGSPEQKSFDGLLRSILSQVLEQIPKVSQILGCLIKQDDSGELVFPYWSTLMLEEAFNMILNQQRFRLRILLFMDALDEYHGRPEFIGNFVESLVNRDNTPLTHLKLCFSSRPWTAFTTRFTDYVSLTIQDFTKADIRRYCLGVMDAKLSIDISIRMEDLISQVVNRSKGVFLWVKLVASDLASAANSGCSEEDLERLLQSLPDELSDYYAEIVRRTPITSRWTLYAMLEIIARSADPLSGPELIGAVECSRCSTYAEAVSESERLQVLRGPLCKEYAATQIRNHAQGLVQIRGGHAELLHQTVKEFVGRPNFSALVLETEAKATFENGHSFLFKWLFSQHDLVEKLTGRSPIEIFGIETLTLHYARMSEKTTGRSMRVFLNSTPPERCTDITKNLSTSVKNPLGYASLAGLLLYFRESIKLAPGFLLNCNRHNQESLVSLALWPLQPKNYILGARSVKYNEGPELVQFILGNGYRIDSEGKVFSELVAYVATTPPSKIRNQYIDIIIRFLELGQDPNALMTIWERSGRVIGDRGVPLSCKPLHISPPEVVPSLIVHGADPNAKDSEGMTPLDRLYCNVSVETRKKIYLHGSHRRTVADSYQVACMLLEAGGQRTGKAKDRAWLTLMDLFSRDGYDVESLRSLAGSIPRRQRWRLPWRSRESPGLPAPGWPPHSTSIGSRELCDWAPQTKTQARCVLLHVNHVNRMNVYLMPISSVPNLPPHLHHRSNSPTLLTTPTPCLRATDRISIEHH
ncbi:hypothetical protein JX265_009173 [Neoarthrinium moseri]|uniref:NACHT domain-containing protein n=1 Tax=Neoarthrinium moseri TaxID=1658444 RepID=A0A9P9WG84_9PEZI|nr:hypothetical protein JX265_009173 [Neoarthrinium moseri]